MSNMLSTIIPKSDQLNADSLIGGPITIKIVGIGVASGDQPVTLHYDGENGRPYKPCKSMRRVLVNCWGSDGNAYVGRYLTLYCDVKVTFGGAAVGGIRISHMSDIAEPTTMALTASRANKKPFTVRPLVINPLFASGDEAAKGGVAEYTKWLAMLTPEQKTSVKDKHTGWSAIARESDKANELG